MEKGPGKMPLSNSLSPHLPKASSRQKASISSPKRQWQNKSTHFISQEPVADRKHPFHFPKASGRQKASISFPQKPAADRKHPFHSQEPAADRKHPFHFPRSQRQTESTHFISQEPVADRKHPSHFPKSQQQTESTHFICQKQAARKAHSLLGPPTGCLRQTQGEAEVCFWNEQQ